MLITEELFAAFINCETKSFLQLMETGADRSEFLEWQRRILNDYKQRCGRRLETSCHAIDECYSGCLSLEDLRSTRYRLVINCPVQADRIRSSIHALERSASASRQLKPYIPIRFVPNEKIAKRDKLSWRLTRLSYQRCWARCQPSGKSFTVVNRGS